MKPLWMVAFVLFDLVLTSVVLYFVVRSRGGLKVAGIDFQKLREYTEFCERTIGQDFRATWSGEASTLPAAIERLLQKLEAEAQAQQLPVERPWLKTSVARWLQSKQIASGSEVREAMKQVA
ncbi:MAG: hypothetical protein ABIU54_02580 [Candidatus Eisenbacteria bacterium]